jgi:hypothetical protein
MRRQFVAVVAASVISAGMTTNAMASGHAGLRHALGYGRFGFAHETLRDWHGGYGSAYRLYGGQYGALSRWGLGLGLGVFGYDDRYCSPSYHACDVYGR